MNTDPPSATDPLPVVEEYLRASDPRIRANAVTALAAVATPESVSRLVETALLDEASVVRDRARLELRELDPESKATAARRLSGALEDSEKQVAANGLLARLGSAGLPVDLPGSFLRRLRLAARVRSAESSRREKRFDLAAARSGLWGGLSGALIVAAVMVLGVRPGVGASHYMTLFWRTFWLAPAFALWTSGWATPVGVYFDRRAAAVTEMLAAARGALIPMLLFLTVASWDHKVPMATVLVGTLCGALGVASIRGATLAAAGSAWASTLAGGGAGAVVLTGIVIAVRLLMVSTVDARPASFAAGVWLLLLPVGFGMALAYSRVDGGPADTERARRRWSFLPALVLPALWVAALLALPSNRRLEVHGTEPDEPLHVEESFSKAPFALHVQLDPGQRLRSEIEPSAQAEEAQLRLLLWHDQEMVRRVDAPDPMDLEIDEAGLYSLEVTRFGETLRSNEFFSIANRLAPVKIGFGYGEKDEAFVLSVSRSPKPDEGGPLP